MAAYLDQHPDIYFAERKEPFFFSSDLPHARAVTDEQDYLALFADGAEQRYRAEGSTWYLYSARAAAAIKEASPEARIIVMLRDPLDLIVSQFRYNQIKGNENIRTVDEAILAEADRRAGRRIPASNRIEAALHYTAMVDFAPQLQRYWDMFGRERVHVILFDELEDTAGCVGRVFDFLGLPDMSAIDLTPENETSTLPRRRFQGLYRTMVTNKGLAGQAKRLLPRSLKSRIWNVLDGLNRDAGDRHVGAGAAKPALSPGLRAELAKTLRPCIDQLARMLDRDLSHWAASNHPAPGGIAAEDSRMAADRPL